MLEISARKVARIIIRAREFDADLPREDLSSPRMRSTAEAELRNYIGDLNDDEKASLVALMWIGRDTFEPEDLAEAIATARAEATVPTADYLLGVPLLADYLEDGLEKIGIDSSEIEDEVRGY
ncbi:MAG: DUF3775 domain-containing protein [Rhodobacteraceae bacterium]|nr:DUF3775 domain-containing protein [Paracoccaceae bacterium]